MLRRCVLVLSLAILSVIAAFVPATPAQVHVFLTDREALRAALGDAERVRTVGIKLDGTARAEIERAAGFALDLGWTRCYQGQAAGKVIAYACIDNMIGKERPITYITRIDHPAGTIGLLEVMQYREAIGAEVNLPFWREQFHGKSAEDPVRLGEDIRNLSGATLSSRGLTNGARKLLALYESYLRDLPLQ